jgi:hypothetical protein
MAAARKVLASARKDGLAKAAGAAGAAVTLTPFFRPGNAASIPDLKLLPDSAAELGRRAALVLAEASPDSNEHPVALVDLPSDRKVLVIELVGAEPVAPADNMYVFQLLKVAQDRHAMAYRLADEYFNYDTITTRLQFHPEATNDRTGT